MGIYGIVLLMGNAGFIPSTVVCLGALIGCWELMDLHALEGPELKKPRFLKPQNSNSDLIYTTPIQNPKSPKAPRLKSPLKPETSNP